MTRFPAFPGRLAVLGSPVAHSRSPAFQNAALRAAGIPLQYEAIDVPPDELARVLAEFAAVRGAGNATIPHKGAMFAACHAVSERAARAGAVNTFWHDVEGLLYGDNTDIAGFDAAVSALGSAREGAVVMLLG
ncbi:MAG: shikimate dehydrogenase, partial [Cytophagaceae bacterium]|nr:shikimate dehydrogenase [Gemmatimonadaceae bacterium]